MNNTKNWDTIGNGLLGLATSLLMFGAIVSLAFEKNEQPQMTTVTTKNVSETNTQVALAQTKTITAKNKTEVR